MKLIISGVIKKKMSNQWEIPELDGHAACLIAKSGNHPHVLDHLDQCLGAIRNICGFFFLAGKTLKSLLDSFPAKKKKLNIL